MSPEPGMWDETNRLLDELDRSPSDARASLAATGLHILAMAGWGLELDACVRCGRGCPPKARTTIDGAPREIRTRPVWAKNSYRRFRTYIDDHSFFFRDILQKDYKSIFDCFYLAKLREPHRNFGLPRQGTR
jgi:recombinational DNA repair protein (RecF pathway)